MRIHSTRELIAALQDLLDDGYSTLTDHELDTIVLERPAPEEIVYFFDTILEEWVFGTVTRYPDYVQIIRSDGVGWTYPAYEYDKGADAYWRKEDPNDQASDH